MTELELKIARLEMQAEVHRTLLAQIVHGIYRGRPKELAAWKDQTRSWGNLWTNPEVDAATSDLMAAEMQEIVEQLLREIP